MDRFCRAAMQLLMGDRFQQRLKGGMGRLQPQSEWPGTLDQLANAGIGGRQLLTCECRVVTNFPKSQGHCVQSITRGWFASLEDPILRYAHEEEGRILCLLQEKHFGEANRKCIAQILFRFFRKRYGRGMGSRTFNPAA